MALLPPFRKIGLEDIKGAPPWMQSAVDIINSFFEFVYGSMNRNLSVTGNLRMEFKSFVLLAGASADLNKFRFATTIKAKPSGVIPISCQQVAGTYVIITNAVTIPSWRWESGEIIIESITGLTNGANYQMAVLVTYD